MGTFGDSENPDEKQHNAALYPGLHCFIRLKQPSRTEIHHHLEISTCDPLKYKMGIPILISSICIRKSIRIQRVHCRIISEE